ncbi:MAG: zinc-dependent dehydrogenase [Candidatus Ratteibacteria bacterium]|jgi:L-iditol 2-dehydrogenase
MKAALLQDIEKLEFVEIEKPSAGPGEIVIRVKACAICGTDIKVFHHGHRLISFPRVTGHELSGIVEETGPSVTSFSKGDRVAIAPAIPCGECHFCRRGMPAMCDNLEAIGYAYNGGFAEYMRVPAVAVRNGCVNPIPDSLDFDTAALAEPLACVINGQSLSKVEQGDTIVILGAGPIGCLHAQAAPYFGATTVILGDISQDRIALADFTGATLVDMSKEDIKKVVGKITKGRMAERVIVAAGSPKAQELGLELVAKRGSVNFFGGLPKETPFIQFNSNIVHYGEMFVTGTHGSSPYHNRIAIDLLASGKIDGTKFITHRFPLADLLQGFKAVEDRTAMKVIINP